MSRCVHVCCACSCSDYLALPPSASGLDSSTAFTIVSLLKHLAFSRGRTIILTIHSPSSKLFKLIDRLLLLTPGPSGAGARVAYHGPVLDVMSYFEKLDLGVQYLAARMGRRAEWMTTSDYLMALLERRSEKGIRAEWKRKREEGEVDEKQEDDAAEETEDSAVDRCLQEDDQRITRIVQAYSSFPDCFPDLLLPAGDSPATFHPGGAQTIAWHHQLQHLTQRAYLTHVRSISHLKAKVFTVLFLAFYVGLLYLQPDASYSEASRNFNQTSIFNRVGYVFFVTCMEAMIRLFNAVLTCQCTTMEKAHWFASSLIDRIFSQFCFLIFLTSVTEERGLFLRECSNRMYSISAYFLSKLAIEIPMHTALSCIFGAIGYAMVGMNQDR
jgi:hypothetical protein